MNLNYNISGLRGINIVDIMAADEKVGSGLGMYNMDLV